MVETWSKLWYDKLDSNLESFDEYKLLNFKRKLEYFRPQFEVRSNEPKAHLS